MERKVPARYDVIGIGHCCVDYIIRPDHFPRPDESQRVADVAWQCGGRVPVGLAAASRAGLKTALISAIGTDTWGQFCRHELEQAGIDLSLSVSRPEGKTGMSAILTCPEGRTIFYHPDEYEKIRPEEIPAHLVEQAEWLYLSDNGPIERFMAEQAHRAGVRVLMDADHGAMEQYAPMLESIDVFAASSFVWRSSFGSDADRKGRMREIQAKGPQTVIFTFGAEGCVTLSGDDYFETPARTVQVIDTTGAGDVFHGSLFYGLIRGLPIRETVRYASIVSAMKCTGLGWHGHLPDAQTVLTAMKREQ